MRGLRRLGDSVLGVLALIVLAAAAVLLALWPVPVPVVGVVVLALELGLGWVGRRRPGPAVDAVAIAAVLAVAGSLARPGGELRPWLGLIAALAVATALAGGPVRQRLVPRLRAAQLPGIRTDLRAVEPEPLSPVAPVTGAILSVLAIIGAWLTIPVVVLVVVLAAMLVLTVLAVLRLRAQVLARRRGTVNAAVGEALREYAPQFLLYHSGPAAGDYQLRMWLPYLDRLGVPYAIIARDPQLPARAVRFTDVPILSCPRMAGLDDCMVPSARTVFYVNTNALCVDGVRFLDRTHVQLSHGDSDKPSSYHPMYAMFDQVFLAGQAAFDRFAEHQVTMPPEKVVLIGRPQMAGISRCTVDPLPGHRTVLYAPTWRGGVHDMDLSSLRHGDRVVRMLLAAGVRVAFRPHPLSSREKDSAAMIARIDQLLRQASTAELPHRTSAETRGSDIVECFNSCDALVADVSSVASDFLASGKPFAVVDPMAGGGGTAADPAQFPVLRAAYRLDLGGDAGEELRRMLGPDPLAKERRELRSYYLGDHEDARRAFLDAATCALHGQRWQAPGSRPA